MRIWWALFVLLPSASFAWGGRGHHVICSTAVHLVKEEGLRTFLKNRPQVMGFLCNVPDVQWKALPREVSKSGDATHYIDPEVLGLAVKEIPLDFAELAKRFRGKPNAFAPKKKIVSVADDFGSLWWRADQFYRRGLARKAAIAKVTPPAHRGDEQNEHFPYNEEIYGLMVDMGLLGHFVSDASQPLHATADYDGYGSGHGGIHAFYEEAVVAEAPADLEGQIFERASKAKATEWAKGTVLERMRTMSELSVAELPKVLAVDLVTKKSSEKDERGLVVRVPAERGPASASWSRANGLLVGEFARSALLLARLWDEMYVAVGKPDLSKYRSFRFPSAVEFVPPDYVSSGATADR